ncbi:hypothetical protein [Desulforamulus aquiferis]|uniref:Uncharacterized protein n=1 Tax=Desulforamulus aquiferis TaxID=1397668 RepID=A0AAW7ZE01_9FIRM|nr:hypothetical protein [Desulforamulus aquiferis]MDO7787999.1 hypothetical protein [Desulforamulus aquiferis]RYD05463.1 hypothetical protein N752_08955 [Desulforamulus aquiferis]
MKKNIDNKENLTRKEALNEVRGEQEFIDHNKGPAKKDSKRNDWNDPQN